MPIAPTAANKRTTIKGLQAGLLFVPSSSSAPFRRGTTQKRSSIDTVTSLESLSDASFTSTVAVDDRTSKKPITVAGGFTGCPTKIAILTPSSNSSFAKKKQVQFSTEPPLCHQARSPVDPDESLSKDVEKDVLWYSKAQLKVFRAETKVALDQAVQECDEECVALAMAWELVRRTACDALLSSTDADETNNKMLQAVEAVLDGKLYVTEQGHDETTTTSVWGIENWIVHACRPHSGQHPQVARSVLIKEIQQYQTAWKDPNSSNPRSPLYQQRMLCKVSQRSSVQARHWAMVTAHVQANTIDKN